MKSIEDVKKFFKNAAISTNPKMDENVLDKVLIANEKKTNTRSAAIGPNIRRTIMKSPITKLAAAAVIVTLVVLGLFELTGTESTSGVVWADVVRKVEASRGNVVRCREAASFQSSEITNYSITYTSPRYSRKDFYEGGQNTHTYYEDFSGSDTVIFTGVYHKHKHYISDTHPNSKYEFFLEQHEQWMNPKYLVQRILSGEHRNLGQETIDGILCEGIETTDPAALGPLPGPVNRLEVEFRLWVDVETKYPVLFEGKMSGEAEGKWMESEWVMDQFQWDVELDPDFLKANIPPDYVDMRTL